MNAAQLHSGELYAWKRNPSKGVLPIDAKKVRLRHTEQHKSSYEKNRRTYAAIVEVDTLKEHTVPAREIIMFWDEYEPEQRHMLKEREERERQTRRERLRGQVQEAMINFLLHQRGVPLTVSYIGYSSSSVSFNLDQLRDWLGITPEDIEAAIDKAMEENEAA